MSPSFDLTRYQDPMTIQRVLHHAKTVAIVGLSKSELRASHFVAYYLARHGYQVIPVNPREPQILGQKSFASLLDVPVPIDVVPTRFPRLRRTRSRSTPAHCGVSTT